MVTVSLLVVLVSVEMDLVLVQVVLVSLSCGVHLFLLYKVTTKPLLHSRCS